MSNKEESIWIDDFKVLFEKNKLNEFFPTKKHTREQRINSIVRLSLYLSIILTIYFSNTKYMYIFIFFIIFTYIIYTNKDEIPVKNNTIKLSQQNKENIVEKLENQNSSLTVKEPIKLPNPNTCTKPTIANPFMNFDMADIMNFDDNGNIIDRPQACDPNDPEIKKEIDKNFNNNLYKDVNDLFGKMNSQRQFFTMPWTTVMNDQTGFAKWLYLNPKTCKEDQDFCLKYEDIRGKRPVYYNPEENPVDTKKTEK